MKFKRRFLAAMSIVLSLTMFAACGNKEGDKKPSDNGRVVRKFSVNMDACSAVD